MTLGVPVESLHIAHRQTLPRADETISHQIEPAMAHLRCPHDLQHGPNDWESLKLHSGGLLVLAEYTLQTY